MVQQSLSLAERQCIERGCNKAVGNVEGGNPVITGTAARVLSRKVERASNGASIVERFGPGVTDQRCQIGSEALAEFTAYSVVIRNTVRLEELDSGRSPLGKWHARDNWCISGKRLADIQEVCRVTTFGAVVADFHVSRLTE